MSSIPAPCHRYTYAEYLRLDGDSNHKNEYFDGEIYGTAGGTPRHAELTLTIGAMLHNQLRGKGCRAYSPDLRVRVLETGLATYPDVAVVCGGIEPDPDGPDTATNPTVLVEVLSDSTEAYDRGEKRRHYQRIPALQEYLLVSPHAPCLELWRRNGEDWTHETFGPGDRVALGSIGCEIGVDDLYGSAGA
jgi:Uma2 family endonuclease